MEASWEETWRLRAELYAFFGNSLLRVMTSEAAINLDPALWESFPLESANEQISRGLTDLLKVTNALKDLESDKAIERVAVEYTRLFVGPGTPAAPPWETLYREEGGILFGKPTFEMRRLFSAAGLKASAESHQFEDHIGFELLFLAVNSARFLETEPSLDDIGTQVRFIKEHPLAFIGEMCEKAVESCTEAASPGYYPALLTLIWGFLIWDSELLDEYLRQ
jgi:TorA maturation chaperone TorD